MGNLLKIGCIREDCPHPKMKALWSSLCKEHLATAIMQLLQSRGKNTLTWDAAHALLEGHVSMETKKLIKEVG